MLGGIVAGDAGTTPNLLDILADPKKAKEEIKKLEAGEKKYNEAKKQAVAAQDAAKKAETSAMKVLGEAEAKQNTMNATDRRLQETQAVLKLEREALDGEIKASKALWEDKMKDSARISNAVAELESDVTARERACATKELELKALDAEWAKKLAILAKAFPE